MLCGAAAVFAVALLLTPDTTQSLASSSLTQATKPAIFVAPVWPAGTASNRQDARQPSQKFRPGPAAFRVEPSAAASGLPRLTHLAPALLALGLAGLYSLLRRTAASSPVFADLNLALELPVQDVPHAFASAAGRKPKKIKVRVNKSIAKRFKVTATGKLMSRRPGKSHKLQKKSANHKRTLRVRAVVGSTKLANNLKRRIGAGK